MTQFTIGPGETKDSVRSDFANFVAIAKGRSIVSAADWGKGRFELGLSGGAMLRVFTGTNTETEINLIQTLNPDELPPFIISLGDMPQRVPLAIIERKLRGLRTLYAIFLLFHTGRLDELFVFLTEDPNGDIEESLIASEDALQIESISYGSWVLAIWAKTQASFKAVSSVAGLAFDRGREAFLTGLEANSRLAQAKARREESAAAKDEFDLKKSQFDYLLKVASKASSQELRERIEAVMITATRELTANDPVDSASYKQLTAPNDFQADRGDG